MKRRVTLCLCDSVTFKNMIKSDIRGLSHAELTQYLQSIGEPAFRAAQIFDWLYKKCVDSFAEMKNLPAPLRQRLQDDFVFLPQSFVTEAKSTDKTKKFLFTLGDREKVETVLIPTAERTTVCVSTQAGCKFGCRFCASGIGGWTRNLTSAEIVSQILHAKRSAQAVPLTNIVFMGVGEPLDNYDNLLKAIRIMNSAEGMNIAARRITISTCGVIPKIQKLAQEGMQLELAISLHGYSNESRNVLMPVNRKYPLKDLIAACREYIKATNRQITFEYILIKDVTCSDMAAQELGELLKGMLCKINLIPYNKVAEFEHERPSVKDMHAFRDRLAEYGVLAMIRTPRGPDVAAACGQLRHSAKKS